MTIGVSLALLAIGLAFALIAYGGVAMERGWPSGTMHSTDKPVFIALMIITISVSRIIYAIVHHGASWWIVALIVVAWFVLAPAIINIFKAWTTLMAILGGPILLITALFIR